MITLFKCAVLYRKQQCLVPEKPKNEHFPLWWFNSMLVSLMGFSHVFSPQGRFVERKEEKNVLKRYKERTAWTLWPMSQYDKSPTRPERLIVSDETFRLQMEVRCNLTKSVRSEHRYNQQDLHWKGFWLNLLKSVWKVIFQMFWQPRYASRGRNISLL